MYPESVSSADLEKAAAWFAEARGKDGQQAWGGCQFTRKPDLRAELRPYPQTGNWLASLSSSGTTAEPVVSPWSQADRQVADVTAREVHRECPPLDGLRCAVIAPNPHLAVAHSMCRQIELSGGAPVMVRPGDPEAMCRTLSEDGIAAVFTLPLVASRLGEYFHGARGGTPPDIRFVFCGGDVLSPARQDMLAQIWSARVFNMFGCSELFGPLAGPSEHGAPLVWRCAPVAIEVLDQSSLAACGAGERGVVVLTTLWPKASPLLRYWTDDIVDVVETASVTGTFAFHYVGRPPSMLNIGSAQVALRDIDDILLGSGLCSSEWSIRQAAGDISIAAEMPSRSIDAVKRVAKALDELIGAPVEFVPKEPGSLPRRSPKFTV